MQAPRSKYTEEEELTSSSFLALREQVELSIELVAGIIALVALAAGLILSNRRAADAGDIRRKSKAAKVIKVETEDRAVKKAEEIKKKIEAEAEKTEQILRDKERSIAVEGAKSLDSLADVWNERLRKKR